MAEETSNPRDNVSTMGSAGSVHSGDKVAPGRVNLIGSASDLPGYTTYEDYDVFSGGKGETQQEYMTATFHTSDMTEGDERFKAKSRLMQGENASLLGESRRFRTAEDVGEETDLNEQEKEAAL